MHLQKKITHKIHGFDEVVLSDISALDLLQNNSSLVL